MAEPAAPFDLAEYEAEAERRWGRTDAWRTCRERTSGYGPEQWQALQEESGEIAAELAQLCAEGVDPACDEACTAAERHRAHIDRWFYDITPAMHASLGDMYVADPRFTAYWDRHGDGLAEFVRDAFIANADRQEDPGAA